MKKKIIMLLMVAFMLIPSMVFAQGAQEEVKLTPEQLNHIKKTIDYSEKELRPVYASRMAADAKPVFSIFHRRDPKLSMADDAFTTDRQITKKGDMVTIKLITQPVMKEYFGKEYWADCTEFWIKLKDKSWVKATPSKEKKPAVNNPNEDKKVPVYFTITVPASDIYKTEISNGNLTYKGYYKCWFETNLEDSGALGVIGDAMMNRNARLGLDI